MKTSRWWPIARPWLAPGLAVVAGIICVATGWLPLSEGKILADRTIPILLFVLAMAIVTDLADLAGVFDRLTSSIARWVSRPIPGDTSSHKARRGKVLWLWLAVVVMAALSTAFFSLDTTAILITPIVVLLARRSGVNPLLFALTTVWLANTASLFLPVSNLTNLLAQERLGFTPLSFVTLVYAPALVGLIVPVAVLAWMYRTTLKGHFKPEQKHSSSDPVLFWVSAVVLICLLPALVSGIPVEIPAVIAAVVLLLIFAIRRRDQLSWSMVPAQPLLLTVGLFIVIQTLQVHGLPELVDALKAPGDGLPALLSVSALGALGSNAVNNLPAYLALEPLANSPLRLASLLIGSNLGPLVTPWASLATLLWHGKLKAAGVDISWPKFMGMGLALAVVLVVLATGALWFSAGMPR